MVVPIQIPLKIDKITSLVIKAIAIAIRGGRRDPTPGDRTIGSILSGTTISQITRRRREARNRIVLERLVIININVEESFQVEKEFLILKITITYVIWSSDEAH